MKKFLLALAFALGLPALASAQGFGAQGIRLVSALPATCSVGQVVFLITGDIGIHACVATDTWEKLESGTATGDITGVTAGSGLTGGGASGTVTLDVGAGYGLDVAADTVLIDLTELLGSLTFGDASTDTIVWTIDRATGTNPTITFNSGSIGFQAITLATPLAVAQGGTAAASASITAFNNITGYSAAGATGTTSTNLVFSTSPTLVTPVLGAATATSIAFGADPGDSLAARFSNNSGLSFELATPGTDATFILNTSDVFVASVDLTVPDEVYGSGWNGSLEVPTKNAVYDKIEASVAGATVWNSIGDADGNNSVALAGFTTVFTSTLDNGILWEITDTDADAAADTTLLKLSHNDGADANVIFLDLVNDKDGTPTSILKVTEVLATFTVDVIVPAETYDATGWNGDNGAATKNDVRDVIEAMLTIPSLSQGDILYGSATDTLSTLAKDTTATRYLSNKGSSNNPSWSTVTLTDGVDGILPVANGGTANAFFTVSGPATSAKTYTFPNSSTTILTTANVITVAQGGTNATSASITAFNNITGYTAAGSTGTTSTNLVFSTSPTLVTPVLGAASATSIAFGADPGDTQAVRFSNNTGMSFELATPGTDATIILNTSDVFVASVDFTVPDEVYGAGWNGSLEVATKNAIYDKLESLGGGGTVTATGGSLTSNAVVLGAGTTDTKVVAGITTDGTASLVLGVNTTTLGTVKMFGNTSGDVTLRPTAVAGTATVMTFQATTGTVYSTGGTDVAVADGGSGASTLTGLLVGNGTSAFTTITPGTGVATALAANINGAGGFTTTDGTKTLTGTTIDPEGTGNVIGIVSKMQYSPVVCQGATATGGLNTMASLAPTATCVTGTNVTRGVATFPDSDGEFGYQWEIALPFDFTGTVDIAGKWRTAATSGDAVFQIATACTADAEIFNDTLNTASTVTETAKGTTLQLNDFSVTSATITGCAAGELLNVKFFRQRTNASDTLTGTLDVVGPLTVTVRRNQ